MEKSQHITSYYRFVCGIEMQDPQQEKEGQPQEAKIPGIVQERSCAGASTCPELESSSHPASLSGPVSAIVAVQAKWVMLQNCSTAQEEMYRVVPLKDQLVLKVQEAEQKLEQSRIYATHLLSQRTQLKEEIWLMNCEKKLP